MMLRYVRLGVAAGTVVLLLLATGEIASAAGRAKAGVEAPEPPISTLIRQLGDEQYSVRQQAQEELARLGADAFDALVTAELNDDIEIATRAAYLVHLIRIDWVRDSDSQQVKELLRDYENQPEDVRRQAMLNLAETLRDAGLEPLCRLIRFERSQLLSKQGAIFVLAQPEPPESLWPQRERVITNSLQGSTRPASKWLLAYVQFHTDPEAALAQWDKLVADELAVVERNAPQTETKIQTLLLRRQAEMLLTAKHDGRATAVMRKLIDRQADDVEGLIEFVEWLVKHKAWSVVDDVAQRFDRTFARNSRLLYTLAQARHAQGSEQLAEQFAERAFQMNANSDDPASLQARYMIAEWLEFSGMMPWCEREYRHIISRGGPESDEVIRSRHRLSEVLHDLERDGEATEILKGLVDLLAMNGPLHQKLTTMRLPPKSVRSRMYYFAACQFAAKNDRARQIEQLDLAVASDPADADVLIALYHLPDHDDKRRQQTRDLIRDAAEQFRNELNDDPDQIIVYNEYAWLIGNTEGDLDRALEYAHKAVEMTPEMEKGGLLDTLAHCYAAKKDFENAVKYQSRAAELDPYSRQIRRALAEYRKALDETKTRK
jgi:tetratricopeptide (TPR) repeat protein